VASRNKKSKIMGIKDNFQKVLNKAITKNPIGYKDMLKGPSSLDEEHDCKKVHPDQSHKEWETQQKEGEMEEATTAASAGAFMAPLGYDPRFKKKKDKKEEVGEATGAASAGQYSTPKMWAKDEKSWRGKAKTQWPGGKFVKVKERCKTFPYCNQGDINALELTDNKMVKAAIQEAAKKTGKDKKYIKELVKKEIEEIIRRSIYKSPITSILGPTTKMNTPIGKIYTMGSNVGGKYE
jgi:hypothetical protein